MGVSYFLKIVSCVTYLGFPSFGNGNIIILTIEHVLVKWMELLSIIYTVYMCNLGFSWNIHVHVWS